MQQRGLDSRPAATSRTRARKRRLWLWLLLIVGTLGAPALALAQAPPGGPYRALVADIWNQDLGGGVVLDEVRETPHEVVLTLHQADGRFAGRLALHHPDRPGRRTGSFAITLQTPFSQVRTPEQAVTRAAILRVVRAIEAGDTGDLGTRLGGPDPSPWRHGGATATLLVSAAFVLVLLIARRRRPGAIDIRPNHLVPAGIQVALYAYWALYVPTVRTRFVDIAAQLVFAYALDALITLVQQREWRFRLAPVPVVLSTNLFMWFIDPVLQCTAIAIALASKEWIQRRGHHIFNPSALALSVLGLLTLTVPTLFGWGTPSPDIELNLPPNMAEWMLLLALIAQVRFPIVLVPATAVWGLGLVNAVGLSSPGPWWPATLLILLLFATDPKTMPRRVAGRTLYGLGIGVLAGLGSAMLIALDLPDTYAKVFPIPILNLLVPQLDKVGDAMVARWERFVARPPPRWVVALGGLLTVMVLQPPYLPAMALVLVLVLLGPSPAHLPNLRSHVRRLFEPAYNRVHVACWLVIAVPGLIGGKAPAFQTYEHWAQRTPHVVESPPGDFPTCEHNPVWCRGFSFIGEAALWTLDR